MRPRAAVADDVPAEELPASQPRTAASYTWSGLLTELLDRKALQPAQTAWAMDTIMSGDASPAQIAGFAVALRAKGETPDEVAGLASSMLAHANPIDVPGRFVDVVGTGGDRAHTVNISTMAAVVVAASGVRVLKHGNRSASSLSGATDVLEALGVVVDLNGPQVARCVEQVGIGFCFAPVFHPALRFAAAPRRELGVPTVFNYLGPVTNPGQPRAMAVGCADARLAGVLARVLADRGCSALVFRGEDGLDELTTATTSRVWIVEEGEVSETYVDPTQLGIANSPVDALRGRDPAYNAGVALAVFGAQPGAVRDAVVLNAAAAIAAYAGGLRPLAPAMRAGIGQAIAAIDSGAASRLLDNWITVSREVADD